MLCTNCGKELKDGAKFCGACGTATEAAPVEETPAIPVVPEGGVAEEAPVTSEPATEAAPPEEAVDASVEPPAEAPAPEKPVKKKKLGLLITIAAVLVVALAVGGLGVWGQIRYLEAENLLAQRQYDEALDIFRSLWIFRDSADQTAALEALQADYDAAHRLIDHQQYEEAEAAFRTLEDYRDSQEMVRAGVTYEKAMFLLECAKLENTDGMEYVEGSHTYTSTAEACSLMYQEAARLLGTVSDYQDAAAQADLCWHSAATAYLKAGFHAEALALTGHMREDTAEAFMPEFLSYCADSTVLEDLQAALQARMDMILSDTYDGNNSQLLLDAEWKYLKKYTDSYFYDTTLQEYVLLYLNGLTLQQEALSDGYIYDNLYWFRGALKRMEAVDALHTNYDFLTDAPELSASYVGQTESIIAELTIERALQKQLWGQSATWSGSGYYIPFTNQTGCDFTVEIYHDFYAGDTLAGSDYHTVTVSNGKTVRVPVAPPDKDWDTWYLNWYVHDITIQDLDTDVTYYTLTGVEASGMLIEGDLLEQTGLTATIVLHGDGTADFTFNGTTVKMGYGDGLIWELNTPDDSVALIIDGDQLSLEVDGSKLIFTEE